MSNKIEGVPDGWDLVRIGGIEEKEYFVTGSGIVMQAASRVKGHNFVIVRKIAPTYRPFANGSEFAPHRDRWLHQRIDGQRGRISGYSDNRVWVDGNCTNYRVLFDNFCFDDDGSPCGVEVK